MGLEVATVLINDDLQRASESGTAGKGNLVGSNNNNMMFVSTKGQTRRWRFSPPIRSMHTASMAGIFVRRTGTWLACR